MDAPLGTVGQELRGARISRGEDLQTVSRILKIRKDHIEALENDDLGALPGRTYAVGFIRAYADHLGLNPVATVERFKTEIAGREEPSRTAGFKDDEEKSSGFGAWLIIALIVVGAVGYGLYYLLASPASQQSAGPIAPPPQMSAEDNSPTGSATRPVKTNTAPGPLATASGQPLGNSSSARIQLRITAPTRVLVQDEGGAAYINKIMQPGEVYKVPVGLKLFLTAEHGNAVQIELDGKPVALPGASGDASEALALDPQKFPAQPKAQTASP